MHLAVSYQDSSLYVCMSSFQVLVSIVLRWNPMSRHCLLLAETRHLRWHRKKERKKNLHVHNAVAFHVIQNTDVSRLNQPLLD